MSTFLNVFEEFNVVTEIHSKVFILL